MHKISIKTNTYIFIAAWLIGLSCGIARADFTFAAFGDTPYTDDEEARFPSMIVEINREKLAFVIHVGDFKSGWSPCTNKLFELRRDQFAWFQHPLIYTPGDNEWADCWRPTVASRATRDPLERLQKLRTLFFADNHALGQRKLLLKRQSATYPENASWEHEGIVFATLNVPGGNNLRMPEEFAERGKANDAWIATAFGEARTQARRAVILVMQANPFGRDGRVESAYASLMANITRETVNFDGEVLLIHGDSHRYRMDQPLQDPRTKHALRNFTRLEVHGYPFMNWVRVRVAQRDGKVTFSASPGV
jgi:hypothetical protein